MDFEYHYSDEQQRFRDEVRSWLDANVPPGHEMPVDPEDMDEETYRFFRSVHQELGARGWLYPTYPREYGGGGLTPEHEMILLEELDRRKIPGVSGGGLFSNNLVLPSILVWGTAEQKERFLPGLLTGKTIAFQTFTEPNAGSDLAALQSRAVRDGDDWIITGQKVFISGMGVPDLLYGPFVTDPNAPRHENLGYFLIPNPLPGLTVEKMALLNGRNQHFIYFDEVRVPGGNLIGSDHDGWQVALTTLEQEHGGRGLAFYRDEGLAELQRYVQDTRRHDRPMGSDPLVQADVVQSYLDSQVHRLLELRNYSMYTEPHGDDLPRLPGGPVAQGVPTAQRGPGAQRPGTLRPAGPSRPCGPLPRRPRVPPAMEPHPGPPRRNHRDSEDHRGAAPRRQPHPGEGGAYPGHRHRPRQLTRRLPAGLFPFTRVGRACP